jgi:hypothetical protein
MTRSKLLAWLDAQAELCKDMHKTRDLLDKKGNDFITNISVNDNLSLHIYGIEKLIDILPDKKFTFEEFPSEDRPITRISFKHSGVKFYGLSDKEVSYFV